MKHTAQILSVNFFAYLTLAYLSNHLGPELYGQLIYTVGVTSIAAFFAIFGRTELELREHFSKSKKINIAPLFFSITVFFVVLLLLHVASAKFNTDFILISLPVGSLLIVGEYLSLSLRVQGRFTAFAILSRPVNLFYFAMLLATIFGVKDPSIPKLATLMLLLYIAAFFLYARENVAVSFRRQNMISVKSFPFWLNSMLFLLHVQAGVLVLGHFERLADVAEYSIAMLVVTVSTMIFSSYFSVLSQGKFYAEWSKSATDGLTFVVAALVQSTCMGILLCLGAYLAIDLLYPYLFDLSKYDDLASISRWMLIVVILRSLQAPLGMFMNLEAVIQKKNSINFLGYGIAGCLSFILAYQYGAFGVLFSLCIGELVIVLCFFRTFLRSAALAGLSTKELLNFGVSSQLSKFLIVLRKLRRRFKMAENQVAFAGYYGFGNFGDDLFVHAVYQELFDGENARHFSCGPRFVSPVVGKLPSALFPVSSGLSILLYRNTGAVGKVYRSLVKLSVLWNADKVVYAGGSLFSSLEKARIFFERIMMLSGIEFSAIGISVGPFSHPAEGEVVIGHLRKFSYLSVRDARSYQLLASHGIHSVLVPDIVYSVDYHGKAVDSDHSKARHRLLLVPAPVGAEHAAEQEYFYNSVHQIALANDWSVSFASFQEKDSTSNFFQFGTWLQYRDDGAEFLNDLSSFDYVISSRLHGGIVASLLGKPFYMFQHHQKITDFLADLNWPHRNRSIPADFLQELPRVIEDAHDLDYRNEIRQEAKSGIRSGILEVIGIKEKLNG